MWSILSKEKLFFLNVIRAPPLEFLSPVLWHSRTQIPPGHQPLTKKPEDSKHEIDSLPVELRGQTEASRG